MPIYEYECAEHGVFEDFRPISKSGDPVPCQECGAAAARILSATRISRVSAADRVAHSRNERSRHEPRVCDHAHHAHGAAKERSPRQPRMKRYGGPRPWVVEHA